MTREELIQLRDAIDLTLALPDSIRELLAQWLAPGAVKPNGRDPRPPVSTPRQVASRPQKPYDNPAHARGAERKLLEAMRERPGASANALAQVVGADYDNEREVAAHGRAGADREAPDGRWRVKAKEPEPRPTIASPS